MFLSILKIMLRPKQLLPLCKGARSVLISGARNNSVDGSPPCPEDDSNSPKHRFNSQNEYGTHTYSHVPSSQFGNKNDVLRPAFTTGKYQNSRYKVSSEPSVSSSDKEAPTQDSNRKAKVKSVTEQGLSLSTAVADNSFGGGLKAVERLSVSRDSREAKYYSNTVRADRPSPNSGAFRRKPKSANLSSRSDSISSTDKAEADKRHVIGIPNSSLEKQRPASVGYEEHLPFSKSRKGAAQLRPELSAGVQRPAQESFSPNPSNLINSRGYCSTANGQVSQQDLVHLSGRNEQQGNELLSYECPFVSQPTSSSCYRTGRQIDSQSSKHHTSNVIAQSQPGKLYTDGNNFGQPESCRRGLNKGNARGSKKINGSAPQRACLPSNGSLVDQVCTILRQMYWGPAAEEALANLNVTLNVYQVNQVLKSLRDPGLALNFFKWAKRQKGFMHDEHSYTTMIGILGRARKFEVINLLLDEMQRDGYEPTVVTYNRLIHCYGRANYIGKALDIFYEMQKAGCRPDRVTYCTLIDIHAKAGFLDVAMKMYNEMQQAGLLADTFTYSVIINCLGKAGELSAAYRLFCEMIAKGCVPNLVTYNIIIDLHAKARKYPVALKVYRDMQNAGFHPDHVTYSIAMDVLGHCGRFEEAEAVFMEMQQAGWEPDEPVYGLLVDMWGKAGNVGKASQWYSKMLNSGLRPNVPTCNSLLSAFLRGHMFNEAHMVLQSMLQMDLFPSLQTYTLLLSGCTSTLCQEDLDLFSTLLANTGHPAHSFLISLPAAEPGGQNVRNHAGNFFDLMHSEDQESKRGFADAIMNFLYKSDLKEEAGFVWEVAMEKNLYPHAVTLKAPNYWSINLHVMSIGTALIALSRTLARLRERMLMSGVEPDRIDIITGWGRRSRVTGSSLVKQSVEQILHIFHSPFSLESGNSGCFVGLGRPLIEWLHVSPLERMHLL